jgi:hypothetical protein
MPCRKIPPLLNQVIAAEPSPEAYLNLSTAHQKLFLKGSSFLKNGYLPEKS